MNIFPPFKNFLLSRMVIKETECLTECEKQKYKVNAINGGQK